MASGPNARPLLFTAVSEEIGLKFKTRTTKVSVVINHVEKPSET
jgi:uncharacterized protein (TIGR03435 family)